MTPLCQHLMPTGKTCQSPALSGQPLCFHHDRAAMQEQFTLDLPPLTSRASILLALSQVTFAMGLNQLDTKRANLLLRSMNLAVRLIAGCEKEAKAAALLVVFPKRACACQRPHRLPRSRRRRHIGRSRRSTTRMTVSRAPCGRRWTRSGGTTAND